MEIPRGMGVFRAKRLEEEYEAKLEFRGVDGVQNKKSSMTVFGYFLELHYRKKIATEKAHRRTLCKGVGIGSTWYGALEIQTPWHDPRFFTSKSN